jgi:hypothetical protein
VVAFPVPPQPLPDYTDTENRCQYRTLSLYVVVNSTAARPPHTRLPPSGVSVTVVIMVALVVVVGIVAVVVVVVTLGCD